MNFLMPIHSKLTLRPYQAECVENVVTAINRGDKQTLVIASTGAGKTICMVRIAELLIEQSASNEVVLILSHLSLLTIQTKRKFEKFSSLKVGVLQASRMPENDSQIVISTVQSSKDFNKIATYYELSGKVVKYIVIDECHYRFSNSYKQVLETFSNAQTIDFSATPFLKGKLTVSHYDSVAYQVSLNEMIEMKYLVKPELRQMLIEHDTSEKLCALFMKTYLQYELGKKAIMFMRTKNECKLLCDALITEGVKAAIVTDAVSAKQRDEIFEGYELDVYDVLLSVNVLTAGYDSPRCESVFMRGTDSPTVYLQRIGRALRPLDSDSVKPHHSKQSARCYVFGTLPEIQSGAFEATHTLSVKPKTFKECTTLEEQKDWLEVNDMVETPEYVMCTASIKVKRIADKIKMNVLSRLIEQRDIPAEFMEKLAKGCDTFKPLLGGDSPASQGQILEMRNAGLTPQDGMTSNEARFLIHSLTGKTVDHHKISDYVAQSGKFEGVHVRDMPWAYKQIVVKKMPGSELAKQIRAYHHTTKFK